MFRLLKQQVLHSYRPLKDNYHAKMVIYHFLLARPTEQTLPLKRPLKQNLVKRTSTETSLGYLHTCCTVTIIALK